MSSPSAGQDQSEEAYFRWCLKAGKPYFGAYAATIQGEPVRHAFMREVVRQLSASSSRPLRVLEVGSWAGGSAITFGLALKEFGPVGSRLICVDPWVPYTFTRGNTHRQAMMTHALQTGIIFQIFNHNISAAGIGDLTITMRGHSAEVLPMLAPESFDIAFIDGDHRYQFVKDDLALVRNLIRVGGVLCGDDLEAQMHQVDRESCVKMQDEAFVRDPKSGRMYHPGVTLAVSEAFGEVAERFGFWATARADAARFAAFPLPDLGPKPPMPSYFSRHPDFAQAAPST